MSKYTTNEFSFDLPERLHDRSLNIFSLANDGPSDFTIVISRSPVAAGKTLEEQMTLLTSELGRQLTGFRLLDQIKRTLGGNIEAEEIRYTYKQNGITLIQRQAGMLLPVKGETGLLWVAITATLGPKATSAWHQSFDAMLESLSFKKH